MSADIPSGCFALFDDCTATAADPRSRLYTGHLRTLTCDSHDQLGALLDTVQQQGVHAVALFPYEFGAALHDIAPRPGSAMLQVLLFASCRRLSAEAVATWLQSGADAQAAGIATLTRSVDADDFTRAIDRIRAYIAAGDTYQVNFTYRLRFQTFGNLLTLYQRLRGRQPVPYGALIVMPDGSATLSVSPELFVAQQDGLLTARPMKGTARASGDAEQDARIGAQLAADPKNRAENLMIVDLLRNDLGRIAATGSVTVPALFTVTRFSDVLQMTSTVTARLRDGVTLAQLITALYPCGSITGAPKRRTMQIIRELETDPRGIYTGAIGWFAPVRDRQSIGDFCLSVPIRTLTLSAPDAAGLRTGEMGVGAGIVHDSVAADEWAECGLKAQFLTGMAQQFSLFETMAVTRPTGCVLLERHLARLTGSAAYFNFPQRHGLADAVRTAIRDACAALPDDRLHRLRLTLQPDGICNARTSPLTPLVEPLRLLLATEQTASDDIFLRHKTTERARYDQAWQEAEKRGAFDMLFCNQRGEITEGGRSTIFVQIDGCWYTPPLSAGVLPGVMRGVLLDDPAWGARERVLTLDDVRGAQKLVLCNALRGVMPVTLIEPI